MDDNKLSERLRFDMKFLLWRAEVYALSAAALEYRFQEISQEYRVLASADQLPMVEHQLAEWHQAVTALASEPASA